MKHTRRGLGLLLAATALLALQATTACAQEPLAPPSKPLPRVSVILAKTRFATQVATDDRSRAYGLMNRTSMPEDTAMLFVFRHAEQRAFWMKDTKIPLDILFFDAHRRLVSAQLDAQPCRIDPCTIYPSNAPAMYVLELAAGTARRIGVSDGATLTIEGSYGKVQ